MLRKLTLVLIICCCTYQSTAQAITEDIKRSVQIFTDSLTAAQRELALFPFGDTLRTQWTNLPVGAKPRKGINIGSMNNTQRILFHRILAASFSNQGYLKITSIMHLDNLFNSLVDTLHDIGRLDDTTFRMYKDFRYGNGNYYISLFGSTSDKQWGYKIEGHHISVNVTCKNGNRFYTPFFLGTLPAQLNRTEYAGWRVLGREQDLGLQLLHSLTPTQKAKAIKIQEVPEDIQTNSESGKNDIEEWGLKSKDLNLAQKRLADNIIEEYLNNFPSEQALELLKKLKIGAKDYFSFCWIGSDKEKEPHYFCLYTASFILEFADVGNHIHSILREKRKEFGESKMIR